MHTCICIYIHMKIYTYIHRPEKTWESVTCGAEKLGSNCMHAYIYIYTYTYIFINKNIYIRMHTYKYIPIHICINIQTCENAGESRRRGGAVSRERYGVDLEFCDSGEGVVAELIYTRAYFHICIYTHTLSRTHTHTPTHIRWSLG